MIASLAHTLSDEKYDDTASAVAIGQQQARPFVKWAGGKRQLLPSILKHFPKKFGCYHEPFIGGGAVYFALQPKNAILADNNEELILTYQVIKDNPEALIRSLKCKKISKEEYYRIRALKTNKLTAVQRASRLIYLNRTCFNGLYRVNQQGLFNVPFGSYKNPTICDVANIRAVSALLHQTKLYCQDVFKMVEYIQPNDLVYFDPPYDPISQTSSFRGYTAKGFGVEEQAHLAEIALKLVKQGSHVVLSNADTPMIRRLYKDFHIQQIMATRRINSQSSKRGCIAEVLITSKTFT